MHARDHRFCYTYASVVPAIQFYFHPIFQSKCDNDSCFPPKVCDQKKFWRHKISHLSTTPQLLTGDQAVQFPIRSPQSPTLPLALMSHLTSVRPQARSLRLPSPGSSLAPSSLPFEVNCEYLRSSCGSDTGICNPLIFNFYKFTVPPQLGRRGVQGMPYLFFDHDFNCLQLHNHFL